QAPAAPPAQPAPMAVEGTDEVGHQEVATSVAAAHLQTPITGASAPRGRQGAVSTTVDTMPSSTARRYGRTGVVADPPPPLHDAPALAGSRGAVIQLEDGFQVVGRRRGRGARGRAIGGRGGRGETAAVRTANAQGSRKREKPSEASGGAGASEPS